MIEIFGKKLDKILSLTQKWFDVEVLNSEQYLKILKEITTRYQGEIEKYANYDSLLSQIKSLFDEKNLDYGPIISKSHVQSEIHIQLSHLELF